EEDVMELSNGCICCTVADDFIPTITKLLEREAPPDHIVIETSGLALPQPLVRAFAWPEIRTRVTVDGVVAVVDGPAVREGRFAADLAAVEAQRAADDGLDHETPLSELFEDQLACADMILVNKADLLDDADALAAELKARARAGVSVLKTSMGAVEPAALLGLGVGAEDDMAGRREVHHHHHHHDEGEDHDHDDHRHHDDHGHDAFESFVLDLPEIADVDRTLAAASETIRRYGVLRLKGFAAVEGKPMRLVIQAVGPRIESYFDRPLGDDPRVTRLVVIGEAGLDRAGIEAALTAATGPREAAA
ncbi:MAG: GTP-binding protein, partial [Pseudomonadota bacterium]